MATEGTPHGIVGGLAQAVVHGIKGVGSTITGALDKPPAALGGPQFPHHIPHRALNGVADSYTTFIGGIRNALDQPVEQFGIPPDLAGGKGPTPPKLPKLGRK